VTHSDSAILSRRSAITIGSLALIVLVVGLRYGTWVAGGADSYGYISQSRLWLEGRALTPQPLPFEAPWPDAAWSLTPLGYRPAVDKRGIVPIYPPGLPIAMAVFAAAGGPSAVYLVVPLLGAVAVWMTGRLGQRLGGAPVAIGGAALVAASPTFVYQLLQPMSDVPAAACWLAALAWAFEPGRRAHVAAGTAVAVAILIRPNLAPLAAIVVGVAAWVPTPPHLRLRDGLVVAAPALLAVLAIAYVQYEWYGSPLMSGYGSAAYVYAASRVPANLPRYLRWLAETHSPLVLLGFAWPFLAWRLPQIRRAAPSWCWVLAVLLLALYLPYLEFDHWSYTRFLLPAIALLWIVLGSALVAHEGAGRHAWLPLVIAAVLFELYTGWSRGVYWVRDSEQRYPGVARIVQSFTPPEAAMLTMQHSGTLRLYANRLTIRWDRVPPEWLDRSIAYLQANQRPPFLAIEDAERPTFIERFGQVSEYGRLDWAPLLCRYGTCLFDLRSSPVAITPRSAR
jgi:hypothetical protein